MNAKLLCLVLAASVSGPTLADRIAQEPVKPIEPVQVDEPAKVELGKKLFFDPAPVSFRFHFLQLVPQPEHGRQ